MDEIDKNVLLELQKRNNWWSTGKVNPTLIKSFYRSDYFVYTNFFDNLDYVDIIIGPRQVGKSTILYQLIQYLLTGKLNPKDKETRKPVAPCRILLLSLESAIFDLLKEPIKKSLEVFEENVLKESLSALNEPVYVFLDEASRRDGWALEVKEYYDMKYKIKFIVTGSSSPALFKKSSESLVGRHRKTLIVPLKFWDVLRIREIGDSYDSKMKLRNSFVESIKKDDPNIFFSVAQKHFVTLGLDGQKRLQLALNDYILRGGYPRFYDSCDDWETAAKIMREAYFEAIIAYDLIRVFNARDPDRLRKMYTFIARSTAQTINIANFSRYFGMDRTTVDDYIHQLQQTYLVRLAAPFKFNRIKEGNDFKKAYVSDVGLRNAVLGVSENEVNEPILMGLLVETVVQDHSLRLKYCLEPTKPCETFFWRNSKKEEVDIVVKLYEKLIPIESKYSADKKSNSIIEEAVAELKSPFGVVLTKGGLSLKNNIIEIPTWLFLEFC